MSRMLRNKKFDEIAAKQGKNRSSKKKRGNSLSPAYGNGYSGSSTSSSSAHRNKMWNSNSGLSNVKERNKLRVLTRSKRLHPHQDDEPQQLYNISQYFNFEDDVADIEDQQRYNVNSDDEVDDKSSSSSRPKEAPSDSVVPLEDYKGTKRKDPPLTQPCEFNSDKVFFGKHTPKTISTNPFRVIYTNYGIRLKRHKAPDNDDGLFIYATHIQKHRLREIGLPPLLFRFGRNTKDDMFCLRIEIAEGHAGDIRKFIRRDGVGDPKLYFDPIAPRGFLRYIHIYSNGDWCQQAEKATNTACNMLAKDKESPLGKLLNKAVEVSQSPVATKEVRICYDV